MNIANPLLPLASAALSSVASGVAAALPGSESFSGLFSAAQTATQPETDRQEAGPPRTGLAQQLQYETLQQVFEQLRQSVHRRLTERLTQRGVQLDEPAVLATGSHGRLLEVSGHWDRAQIEQVLQDDPQLRSSISQLIEQGHMLWEMSPEEPGPLEQGRSRLVVTEKEAFFQVV